MTLSSIKSICYENRTTCWNNKMIFLNNKLLLNSKSPNLTNTFIINPHLQSSTLISLTLSILSLSIKTYPLHLFYLIISLKKYLLFNNKTNLKVLLDPILILSIFNLMVFLLCKVMSIKILNIHYLYYLNQTVK